jgi:hypothetical protein
MYLAICPVALTSAIYKSKASNPTHSCRDRHRQLPTSQKIREKTSSLYLLATHPRHDKVSRHLSLGGTSIKSAKSITSDMTANFIEQEAQQVWWAGADCYFLSMVTGKSKTQYIAENCPWYMGSYKRRRQVISLNKSSWKNHR